MLSNKDEKRAESRVWWRRQRLSQDMSLALQPCLPLRTMTCTCDHRSYLLGAGLHGDLCFPPHPKLSASLPQRRPREVIRTNQGL